MDDLKPSELNPETRREVEVVRAKLISAEASGFKDQSPTKILSEIKSGLGLM